MAQKVSPKEYVLWSDEVLLVVNKPAGILTIPGGANSKDECLLQILQPEYGRLWVVHRLDRDTSGVLLYARESLAHAHLNRQFERREVKKVYHAVVAGRPDWDQLEASYPLLVDGDRSHRTVINSQKGKPASTSLKVIEVFHGYSLIEARPHSGYTHQIRAHLAKSGFPIAGDTLYGDGAGVFLSRAKPGYKVSDPPERSMIERVCLHARSIELIHPLSDEPVSFEAPYPRDFAVALSQLHKYSE